MSEGEERVYAIGFAQDWQGPEGRVDDNQRRAARRSPRVPTRAARRAADESKLLERRAQSTSVGARSDPRQTRVECAPGAVVRERPRRFSKRLTMPWLPLASC